MHELALCDALLKMVRDISREEALDGVCSITVRVGTLSGVIPHFLTDCWVAVTDGTEYDGVPCDKCAPGGPKAAAAIAKIMGGEASAVEKKAVVQCQGSSEHCKPAYDYKGIQTCAAAAALYGGPKTCSFACIGLGDCTKVCKFDAIHLKKVRDWHAGSYETMPIKVAEGVVKRAGSIVKKAVRK